MHGFKLINELLVFIVAINATDSTTAINICASACSEATTSNLGLYFSLYH